MISEKEREKNLVQRILPGEDDERFVIVTNNGEGEDN